MRAAPSLAQMLVLAAVCAGLAQPPYALPHAGPPGRQGPSELTGDGSQAPGQDSPSTGAGWAEARALLDEARAALERSDYSAAREGVARVIDSLLSAPLIDRGESWALLLDGAGQVAWGAQDAGSAKRSWEQVLEVYSRTLSAEHPDLTRARGNLALTLRSLGDLRGARALLEEVLEVRSRTLPADHPALQRVRLNLAGTIRPLGELGRARALYEEVLEVYARTLPAEHPHLQAVRLGLANTLSSLGELHGARALYEEVLEVRSRSLPPEHPDVLAARQGLAVTVKHMGDLHAARALEEQVLEVRSRILPADHPDLQWARANLAVTLKTLGDLHSARALEEKIFEVRSRVLPAAHPDLQAARQNLALTLQQLGDLEAARALFEQALGALSQSLPEDHPSLCGARLNLAMAVRAMGDLVEARELFEQALEGFSRSLPADHLHLQIARVNLAVTLKELGDLHRARALEEEALAVLTRTMPADHPHLQSGRNNLAVTLEALGDLQGARALLEDVLEISSQTLPSDHPDLQRVRSNLAVMLRDLGDFVGARALQEEALEVRSRTLPPEHPDIESARGSLAMTLLGMGDLHGARAIQDEVHEVLIRTLPADHPRIQTARQNLAVVLVSLGDLAGAQSLLEKALEVRSRTLPPEHPGLQAVRMSLAATLTARNFSSARMSGGADLGHGERAAARERSVALIVELCRAQARSAREAVLVSSRREAEERGARMELSLGWALSFALGFGTDGPAPALLAEAFVLSEATRAVGLAAAAVARGAAGAEPYQELRANLRDVSEEVASLARMGAAGADLQAAIRARDALEVELLALARELVGPQLDLFELDPEQLASALGEGRTALAYRRFTRHSLHLVEEEERSRPDALAWEATDHLGAFVLRGGRAQHGEALDLVDLGPIAPIERAVEAWREGVGVGGGRGLGLETPSLEDALEVRGHELRALILDPLLPALENTRHVVLVPDGVLHLVPFDALPSQGGRDREEAPSSVLGERFRFEVRSTLGELLTAAPELAEGLLVALGGANFDDPPADLEDVEDVEQSLDPRMPLAQASAPSPSLPGVLRGSAFEGGFAPLDHTGREARELARLFEGRAEHSTAELLEGRRASRAVLESIALQARWLHIATHGWFAPLSIRSWQDHGPLDRHTGLGVRLGGEELVRGSSPMVLCGLALAGANLPPDPLGRVPGLVTAEELSTLDLAGCELAVLSACDTNLGELSRAGQGVASLQKALHMAGARSVITSLWKVPDEATAELMLDFYRRLWVEGKPKHQALWEAKQRLREATDQQGRPLYTVRDWGAWVLTGEPE